MARDLDESRKPFLMNVGDVIYIQGGGRATRSRHSYATASEVQNDAAISFLMNAHGKILEEGDAEGMDLIGSGEDIQLKSGTHGMLISHFWTETKPTPEELQENEDAKPIYRIYCLVMIDDKMVLASEANCNKTNLTA